MRIVRTTTNEQLTNAVAKALGAALRKEREARYWTREDLVARLPSLVHAQTLASYEVGKRQVPIGRLVEIGLLLEVPASLLLARALKTTGLDSGLDND